jgi:filamentous hemagglutinin
MKIYRRPARTARTHRNLSLTALTGLAVARTLVLGGTALAAPPVQLPVPCAAGACVPNKTPGFQSAPTGFVTSGAATATQSGNSLTVTQTTNQAILNWASFNIGAGGAVTFQQPGSTSIALNKIYQNSPSQILGSLSANGQIYLLNPNGFVFGANSKVNVAGLVASSLGLTGGDDEFAQGLLSQIAQKTPASALSSDNRIYVTDASGNLVRDANGNPQPVQISVEPGAQITAANGGRLLLAGQSVTNGGTLSAPAGQITLAAGQQVFLAASADPALRGLVVEVNNNGTQGANLGTVTNQAGATLTSPQGNVSLIGLAVNQSGRISATTTVSSNGSVILRAGQGGAQDAGVVSCADGEVLCVTRGGTLTLGAASEIDVLPEYSDKTTAAVAQAQLQSSIQLTGQKVFIQGGQISAPGGVLDVLAATNPDKALQSDYDPNAELRVAAGTSINLAGSNATVPMSSNLVQIQLNSNELADDPSQRNGALKGKTVIVDVRNGKPAIISASSWLSTLQGIQENIAQRTSAGGSASFRSVGDVVVNPGATINVSGGQWNYTGGVAQTSQLLGANGKLYEVSSADPNLAYTQVINPTYKQDFNGFGVTITSPTPGLAHYDQGYTQGFSAGSVTFAAPALSLQGNLIGHAVNGAYQRSAAAIPDESLIGYLAANGGNGVNGNGGLALGGTLVIGDATQGYAPAGAPYLFAPAVTFANSASPIIVADGAPLPPQGLQLTTSYITSGGFTQTHIFSDSTVTLPAGLPLNLGLGADFEITAPRIDIDSNITALSGTIALQGEETAVHQAAGGSPRLGVDIGAGVTFDVSGQWTNDLPYLFGGTPLGVAYQNGGTIKLGLVPPSNVEGGGELVLGDGVNLHANGGAWLKSNGSLTGGSGGKIILDASPYESALDIGKNVSLAAFAVQGAAGGQFSLSAPVINVVQGDGSWAAAQRVDWLPPPADPTIPPGSNTPPVDPAPPLPAFQLGAGLFSNYGFSSVSLTATAPLEYGSASRDLLTVTAGTNINAQAQSLQLLSGVQTRATGGTVQGFARPQLLPEANRNPYTVKLSVVPVANGPTDTVASYGGLDIAAGSSIIADAGSTIALTSQGSIHVDGLLRTPGGTIDATISVPNRGNDYGFLASQALEIGATAVLDVSGKAILTPNDLGLSRGNVLAGGTIDLTAKRGSVIVDRGALIDIDGGSAVLDVQNRGGSGGYTRATMGNSAGTLSVESGESISLLGTLSANAGASSLGKLEGGTLNVILNAGDVDSGLQFANEYQKFPSLTPTIDLISSTASSSPSASYGNQAFLGITELEQSGIDILALRAAGNDASGSISIDSSTPLTMGREISLDTVQISVGYGVAASLNAPYVSFTDTNTAVQGDVAALGGTGSLNITASQIVLSGYTGLQGVGNAIFTSAGDVELEPTIQSLSGSFSMAGDLQINAARVYPATYAAFTINDNVGDVTIGQTSASPGTPLSAGGALTINANNILSRGTILAPFGAITLNGKNSVDLQTGSVTSVSADGAVIPYGQTTLNQGEWLAGPRNFTTPLNGSPLGEITLNAPNVAFDSGAKVDLSGGGDLSAYEWVPGTGGSVDVLNTTPNLYAIVPSVGGSYAAYDAQRFGATNAKIGVGASIYLSGYGSLPAGVYTLLPATFALSMPGAYLIQAEPGFTSAAAGSLGSLANGAPVVAGYMTFGNTGLRASSGYQGFAIYPGSYGQTLAQYDVNTASSYFAAAAAAAQAAGKPPVNLPADAATLLIQAGASLHALGSVNSAAGTGGTGATIEISSDNLTVTASATDTISSGVAIAAPVLQSWNAGNLILGGQLMTDASGAQSLNVTASSVTIAQGAQFSANQVIAVASDLIDVQSGAIVASTSGAGGAAPKSLPQAETITLSGANPLGAALLSVSDSNLVLAGRNPTNPDGTPAAAATAAIVNIESGATLSTRGALSLDSPSGLTVAGTIDGPGASWSLASNSIAFAGPGITSTDTLVMSPALLAQMQMAGAARLTSAGAIDFLTSVNLGATGAGSSLALNALTLTASAINNCADCSTVLGARTLTLGGTPASTAAATGTRGTGTLTLVADTLNLGGSGDPDAISGNLAINGNSQTNIQVSGAVVGQGTATAGNSTISFGGDVSIAAAELTAASRTGTAIAVSDGDLTITQNGAAAPASSLAASLGGQLAITANSITDTGSIIVPGGTVSLAATGNIALGSGATVSTAGITVRVADMVEAAAGGNVTIAAGGDLALAGGTTINVSGAGNAPAGALTLSTPGNVTIDGTLLGNAAAGSTGGSFLLDAGTLSGGLSPALVNNLTQGGFNNQIGIEVHTGDLSLDAVQALTANNIVLSADAGAVNVGGTLTATAGAQSGFIGLYGGTGVSLQSGSLLTAKGIASSGHGGTIELSSTCPTCSVTIDSRSTLVTTGGVDGGDLVIAAPMTYANNVATDVAINVGPQGLGASTAGVGKIIVEAMLPVFNETRATIAQNLQSDVDTAANDLASAGGNISARLNPGGDSKMSVQAGVQIEDTNSNETLVLPSLNLTNYSSPYNGAPRVIDLTVRAAGGLTLGGNITDGYDATFGLYTAGADSASLRFVAGADLASANPLATALVPLGGAGATLNVGNPTTKGKTLVSTGTGNIEMAASGNVNFVAGSSAYTTGVLGAPSLDLTSSAGAMVDFPTGGGNVVIKAGQDVTGVIPSDDASVSFWQVRSQINEAGVPSIGLWGINLAGFAQHPWDVATLGGGDATVAAGRDVVHVTAGTADTLIVSGTGNTQTLQPGGGLAVTAGRDVTTGEFYVADGAGTVVAGRSLGVTNVGTSTSPDLVGSLFYVQNAQVSVWAQDDLNIAGVVNPTQIFEPRVSTQFWSYGPDSGFSAQSAGGDINFKGLNSDTAAQSYLLGPTIRTGESSNTTLRSRLANTTPSLRLVSLEQDINLPLLTLYPSPTGQLELFAGKDISGSVFMSDAPSSVLSTITNVQGAGGTGIQGAATQTLDFAANLHLNDATPAVIVAGEDINNMVISVPKAAVVEAGRDIVNLTYLGENLHPDDLTLISAGRDFKDPATYNAAGAPQPAGGNVQVGGPGSLMLLAGRDIDLGFSNGVTTVGNLRNPNLPTAAGANITMVAGLGDNLNDPSYASFYEQIIAPSATYQKQLVSYVESLTGESDLSTEQADAEFQAFAPIRQQALIDSVFFQELALSGQEANQPKGGFTRGYSAIDALFPGSRTGTAGSTNSAYQGDLNLTYSQIYTDAGGDISLFAPGGSINVGLAVAPSVSTPKLPSQLGIVAEGTGDVNIYSKSDVNVDSSRIFTLGGGNILIWSDEGNIDAGKGSKTSLSAPPPTYAIDAQGNVVSTFGAAVAGSGIRTIQTNPADPAGNVNLIAPKGFVNAGEAGIGAAGNLNIAALSVLNVANISAGGTSTGVPPLVSGITASLASAASAASSATTSVTSTMDESATKETAAPLSQTAISWLDVFVSGLGEENCKPEDTECLKRQKQE